MGKDTDDREEEMGVVYRQNYAWASEHGIRDYKCVREGLQDPEPASCGYFGVPVCGWEIRQTTHPPIDKRTESFYEASSPYFSSSEEGPVLCAIEVRYQSRKVALSCPVPRPGLHISYHLFVVPATPDFNHQQPRNLPRLGNHLLVMKNNIAIETKVVDPYRDYDNDNVNHDTEQLGYRESTSAEGDHIVGPRCVPTGFEEEETHRVTTLVAINAWDT
ncbi:hypothetical protein QBC36DRAFT_312367 [Triangularia setosa]|uniref:Uncharacterized protein n=1 Tax=Triangularia setosa TaxID=2587417 RepID=A0AAN7A6F7_9PEZI|nr:hypothetical protein QBC36DRAFT_312367 [Podospora setosa]